MVRSLIAVSLFAVLGSGCESSLVKDLDDFCKIVAEVDRDRGLTTAQKLEKIDSRKAEYARPQPAGTPVVWEKLPELTGEDKYKHLLAAAQHEGNNKWSCSSYKRLVNMAEFERIAHETAEKEKAAKAEAEKAAAEAKPGEVAAADPAKATKPERASKKKKKKKRRN